MWVRLARVLVVAGAVAAAVGLGALALTAGVDSPGRDEPKRTPVVEASPIERVPAEYAQTGSISIDLDSLPLEHGRFVVLPPGSGVERPRAYGDERDSWMYTAETALSLADVPDDPMVREPDLPAGFELIEAGYFIGRSPDGERYQLSELVLYYGDGKHQDITVKAWRPIEFALGQRYPFVASEPGNPLLLDVDEISASPVVLRFMNPESGALGFQEILMADGDFIFSVSANGGFDFDTLTGIAESVLPVERADR